MSPPSPLLSPVMFRVGPIPITKEVVTTWAIVAVLGLAAYLSTRRLEIRPGRLQAALEALVTLLEDQIRAVVRRDPAPFVGFVGTLFVFIAVSNLSSLVPGVSAPTASIETPAALAAIVFLAVHVYGIREKGLWRYLKAYAQPNALMLPLNVMSEITRTFSLMIRLFGNMMSHEFIIGMVVVLAGILVPIPFMALGILIGLIQAYIFAILATVFIGAATETLERPEPKP